MNEHAKSIWQAWLDEKEVQYYAQFGEHSPTYAWINADPSDPELFTPQECTHRWRIKPEKKSEERYFRVYLDKNTNSVFIYYFSSNRNTQSFENMEFFGGWITNWLSYTVEVEE